MHRQIERLAERRDEAMEDWKKELDRCAQAMEIDPAKKNMALDRISKQAERAQLRYRPGWLQIVRTQLLCVPGSVWILQGLLLALLPFAESFLRQKAGVEGWRIFPPLSLCMALFALVFVNELSRHFSCKMSELEQSCYLNLSQLWLMRVCCISGVDVLWVFLLGIGRAQYYGFGWFAFSVYALTPFFLANAALLAFFTLGRGGRRAGQIGILGLLGAFMWTEFSVSSIYEKIWLPLWVFLLVTAVLMCAAQICEIGRKMEDEGLCWS